MAFVNNPDSFVTPVDQGGNDYVAAVGRAGIHVAATAMEVAPCTANVQGVRESARDWKPGSSSGVLGRER